MLSGLPHNDSNTDIRGLIKLEFVVSVVKVYYNLNSTVEMHCQNHQANHTYASVSNVQKLITVVVEYNVASGACLKGRRRCEKVALFPCAQFAMKRFKSGSLKKVKPTERV